jgi:hypothetical protein
MVRIVAALGLALAALLGGAGDAAADADYLFPQAGHLGGTLATGVPYVAIADATMGFGSYAALGGLVGLTPRVLGLGVRPRLALPLGAPASATFRIYAIAPLLYYPKTSVAPWVLARPTLALENRATEALRLAIGGGALWASSVGALQGEDVPLSYEKPSEAEIAARRAQRQQRSGALLFWTLSASAALQLSAHDAAFLEVTTVMEDAGFAGPRWTNFGGPPVTFALGVTHTF